MADAARAYRARDLAEAERCCRLLLAAEPAHFDALHLLGVVCLDRASPGDALAYLSAAAEQRPQDAQANYHHGTALLGLKQFAPAVAALQRALTARPDDRGTLNNLGNALAGTGQHDAAIDCFRRVLALEPGHAPALYNLARALAARESLEEAAANFRTALAHAGTAAPERLADIYAGLGDALVRLGRYDEALATCHAAAAVKPEIAAWNESLVLLLLGRFDDGWRKYEGRWQVADHDHPRPDARVPALAEVADRRVLLVAEQGHGDMLQFARYAPLLAAHGAHVTLQTYPELLALMRTLPGIDAVIAVGEAESPVDIVTPLLSLPLVFGTRLHSIPAAVPYLRPPADRLAACRDRLGPRGGWRVGLAWWGSQHIPRRSIPVERLRPLLACPGIEWHALQQDIPPDQREWLATHARVADHTAALTDFADTAALIACLDLVVTIDTAVAHLAGALGVPVWIMLPHSADWRWLLGRSDSPWYPTARLFRQPRPGDWDSVVADVVDAAAAHHSPGG